MKKLVLSGVVILSCLIFTARGKTVDEKKATTLKIGMTHVFVNNPVEAFKFYTEILGFEEVMYRPEINLAIVASPQDINGTVLLLEPTDKPIAKTYQEELYNAGIPVIVFFTGNIHAEYERLKKLGVLFKSAPTETEWGILALFDDTCGNWIQIHQKNP